MSSAAEARRARRRKQVPLELVRMGPNEDVLDGLADLTARAKRGQIRGFAIATICDQNSDGNSFVLGDGPICSLVLGLERVKKRLLELG